MTWAQRTLRRALALALTGIVGVDCGGRARTVVVIDESGGNVGTSAAGVGVTAGNGGSSGSHSGSAGSAYGGSPNGGTGGERANEDGAEAGRPQEVGGSPPAADAGQAGGAGEAGARAEAGRGQSAGGAGGEAGAGSDGSAGRAHEGGAAGETGGSLACDGEGSVYVVPDECIADGGFSAGGDSLELYCCGGTVRFCLSGEECPWRSGCTDTDTTCSRAGLESDYLANAWCSQWRGHYDYFCSPQGHIYFEGDAGARSRRPFVSDTSWTVYDADPRADASANPLGSAQPVCLNDLSSADCPSGAVSWDYVGTTAWELDLTSIPGAEWIWGPGLSASSPADLQRLFFVREFELGAMPTGTLAIGADDYAEVHLNGMFLGSVGSVSEPTASTSVLTRFDLNGLLQEGSNVITIVAQNGPAWFTGSSTPCTYSCNPAGVVFGGEFTFE